jgi:hypothetical protein
LQGLPAWAQAQVPFTQFWLQQSLALAQEPPVVTQPHVVPSQNPLQQSPPLWHGPGTLAQPHVPLLHTWLQQSVGLTQALPDETQAQVPLSQNWLQQSPPKLQGEPTPAQGRLPADATEVREKTVGAAHTAAVPMPRRLNASRRPIPELVDCSSMPAPPWPWEMSRSVTMLPFVRARVRRSRYLGYVVRAISRQPSDAECRAITRGDRTPTQPSQTLLTSTGALRLLDS